MAFSVDKIAALNDWVLLKRRTQAKETMYGNLIIRESQEDLEQTAEVVAIGPGHLNKKTGEREPMTVKVGDVVFVQKYGEAEVSYFAFEDKDAKYSFVREEFILAIAKEA